MKAIIAFLLLTATTLGMARRGGPPRGHCGKGGKGRRPGGCHGHHHHWGPPPHWRPQPPPPPPVDVEQIMEKKTCEMLDNLMSCFNEKAEVLFPSEETEWEANEMEGEVLTFPIVPLVVNYPTGPLTINSQVTTGQLLDVPDVFCPMECSLKSLESCMPDEVKMCDKDQQQQCGQEESEDLYTFMITDVDIVNPDDPTMNSFIHMLVTNLEPEPVLNPQLGCSKTFDLSQGDVVFDLIPPFSFQYSNETGLVQTADASDHRMVYGIYKQTEGTIDIPAPPKCPDGVFARAGDYIESIVTPNNLELTCGTFIHVPYSFDDTDYQLCEISKCLGEEFPAPIEGITDRPEC